jgi:hypothetical protein
MDLGDWQELSRLRFENHAWHVCIDAIVEAIEQPGATANSIAEAVDRNVTMLNERLQQTHRRPVAMRPH